MYRTLGEWGRRREEIKKKNKKTQTNYQNQSNKTPTPERMERNKKEW